MLNRRSFIVRSLALGVVSSWCASGGYAEEASQAAAPEDIAFTADCDGSEQRFMIIRPKGEVRDALIALHGHGNDRRQFATDPRDECRASRDVAARHGMLFVSPDYRAKTSWMGPKAEADTVQLIGILKKDYGVSRVFICGGSMGGSSALTFAVLHPELVAGVASMNGTANHVEYANFQDAIAPSFGGSKEEVPEEYRKRSAEFFPEKLTMPVGITAGGKDDLVPSQSVVRLAKALEAQGRDVLLLFREEGGHSTNYDDACRILEYVIGKAKPDKVH